MGHSEGDGIEIGELRPVVSELEQTVHEARVHVGTGLADGGLEPSERPSEVAQLRRELTTTRQELRRLEQYVVALEERIED
jgi:transposase-like protein